MQCWLIWKEITLRRNQLLALQVRSLKVLQGWKISQHTLDIFVHHQSERAEGLEREPINAFKSIVFHPQCT